ncbi:MAG: LytTR family DNA-binding domain-containing protein [Bacteroidota bacterium]|jgi:DNA-binding LytR/AlgR family response regulator
MKAIIIEDEKLVARELSMKIAEIDADLKILEVLPSVKTALKWFDENLEPDVIFADIQLSDGVSFEIFEKFAISCPIIFTTSYNEYAIRAFKVNGIDYLLKPVEPEELEKAIKKAKKINKSQSKSALDLNQLVEMLKSSENTKPVYKEHFLCNHRNAWVPVKTEEMAFFMYDTLIYVYTKTQEKYNMDSDSMDEIEEMLNPDQFFRVNRQFIINRDFVQRVWGIENSKMMIKLKEPHQAIEIDISRQKAPIFKKWLEK